MGLEIISSLGLVDSITPFSFPLKGILVYFLYYSLARPALFSIE